MRPSHRVGPTPRRLGPGVPPGRGRGRRIPREEGVAPPRGIPGHVRAGQVRDKDRRPVRAGARRGLREPGGGEAVRARRR
ncbi:hypothetical protein THAOC_19808, partial [Thalassiosira oceanica]